MIKRSSFVSNSSTSSFIIVADVKDYQEVVSSIDCDNKDVLLEVFELGAEKRVERKFNTNVISLSWWEGNHSTEWTYCLPENILNKLDKIENFNIDNFAEAIFSRCKKHTNIFTKELDY
jgi:hypothetical protein